MGVSPFQPLMGMVKNMPSTLKTVASMAKVESDGTPAIVSSAVEAASAKDVEQIQQQQKDSLKASNDRLATQRSVIENDDTLSDEKRQKKLDTVDAMKKENDDTDPMVVDDNTKAALVDANRKKLEPTILASLAPFTALIGIPIFLTQLLKYLGPAGSGLSGGSSSSSSGGGGGGGGGSSDGGNGKDEGNGVLE